MPNKDKKKGEVIKKGRITFSEYEAIYESFLETNSVSKTARRCGISPDQARLYIKHPYPVYGGEFSIEDRAIQARREAMEEAVNRTKNVRLVSMNAVNNLQIKMLELARKAKPELKGRKLKDGSIAVTLNEIGRLLRNLGIATDAVQGIEQMLLPPAPKVPRKPGDVNVNVGVQNVQAVQTNVDGTVKQFEGARDLGPKFQIPKNPQTSFEHALVWQSQHPAMFAALGGPNHEKVLEAVRQGHEARAEMENNHLRQLQHDRDLDDDEDYDDEDDGDDFDYDDDDV